MPPPSQGSASIERVIEHKIEGIFERNIERGVERTIERGAAALSK
ncbi:MAG: hypothetical protein AMXMBFR22_13000 [Phycisphaerae bacterium]